MNENLPELITTKQFALMLEVSTQRITILHQDPRERDYGFPKPYKLSDRLIRWSKEECIAYKERRKHSLKRRPNYWREGFISTRDAIQFLGVSINQFNFNYRWHPKCPKPHMFKSVNFYNEKELAKFKRVIEEEREKMEKLELKNKAERNKEMQAKEMGMKKEKLIRELIDEYQLNVGEKNKAKIVLFMEKMFLSIQISLKKQRMDRLDEFI